MSADEPKITVTSIPAYMTLSRQELDDARNGFVMPVWFAMTPEQEAEWDRRAAEKAARVAALRARYDALAAALTGVLAAIAEVHEPDADGTCRECSGDEWDCQWPCETSLLILADAGV